MGIGREVADAYIEVHGDLKKFRKSLAGAAKDGRALGMDAADSFSAGWDKRTEANFAKKWDGIMDSLHSNKKVDWNRLVGTFDAKGFADAKGKINSFLAQAAQNEIITEKEYQRARKAVKATMDLMRDEHDLALKQDQDKKKLRERDLAFKEATKQAIKDARIEQDKYNKSFAGMFQNNRLRELESDFRRITAAMGDGDWSKFDEAGFHLYAVTKRVKENVEHMQSLGRVTDEEGERIIASVREHVKAETERRNALALTADQTRRAKEETDRYKNSLQAMVDSAALKDVEDRFKAITKAMATADWGPVAKDSDTVREFRREVMHTATQMQNMGRISQESYDRIGESVRRATRDQSSHNLELTRTSGNFMGLGKVFDKLKGSWSNMDKTVKLVLTLIAAAAGPIATLGSGLASGATALVSSLGMAAGAMVPLAAGAGAFVAGIALAVSSLDEVRKRLPGIDSAMKGIGATWKREASAFGKEWGNSLQTLLQSFNTQLAGANFGAPFGRAAREITDAFTAVVNGPGFNALLRAMETDLPAAMSGMGRGIAGLAGGLASLFAGAAPAAKALGEDFAGWGAKISASLEKARESGKLNEVFMKSREALLAVLDAAGSVGSALGTMFMIGSDSGNNMLRSLTAVVDKFNEWMHTESGRASMMEWFQNGERIIRAMEPVAVGLGTALNGLVTDYSITQFEDLMGTVGEILPILGELLGVISDLGILNILADAVLIVGKALEPLMPPLRDLARELGPALQEMLIALQPAFSEIGEALVPVAETLAELAVELLPVLVPLFIELAEELVPLISSLGEILEFTTSLGGPGGIEAVITKVEGLGNMVVGAAEMINGALDIVIGVLTGDWDRAVTGAQEGFDGKLKLMEGSAVTMFGSMGESIVSFTKDSAANIAEWQEGSDQRFVEAGHAIATFVEDTGRGFAEWHQGFTENLVTKGGETIESAKSGFRGMQEDMGITMELMGAGVGGALDLMWMKFDETFPGTRQLATEEYNFMKDHILEGSRLMSEGIGEKWDEISAKTGEVVNGLVADVGTWWDDLNTNTQETFTDMNAGSGERWVELGTMIQTKSGEMKDSADQNIGEMQKNTDAYMKLISEASGRAWDTVSKKTSDTVKPMVKDVGDGFIGMKNDAGRWLGEMGNEAKNNWNRMVSEASGFMDRMGESIRNGVQNAINWVITLPRRMVEAVTNPNLLSGAGAAIMKGFETGLRNQFRGVMDFVGGVADWIAKNKGPISYDKVLLVPAGKAIMSGLLTGLESRMPDLEKSVQSVTEILAAAVPQDAVDSAAAAARSVISAVAAEFDSSAMYVSGLDAAAGLAAGLAKGSGLVRDAYGDLAPPTPAPGTFTYTPAGGGADAAGADGGKHITVESGAIRLESKVTNPEHAADKVLDGLITLLP